MRISLFLSLLGILLVAAAFHPGYAQIPNSGFETWTGGAPDSWQVNNAPPTYTAVTQSADAHSGSSAAAGAVVSFSTFVIPPSILSGATPAGGFAVSARHPAVHAWYKFTQVSGDNIFFSVFMQKGDNLIGTGAALVSTAQGAYAEVVANINYVNDDVPDTCLISFSIVGNAGQAHVGSSFIIDDVSFGPSTGVEATGNIVPTQYALSQNYPNPFNPATLIEYSLPHAGKVRLQVFDLLGKEVASLVDEQQGAGTYRARFDGSSLPSGSYFYRLQADGFSQTKKFLLVK